jgi:hypothetical protein
MLKKNMVTKFSSWAAVVVCEFPTGSECVNDIPICTQVEVFWVVMPCNFTYTTPTCTLCSSQSDDTLLHPSLTAASYWLPDHPFLPPHWLLDSSPPTYTPCLYLCPFQHHSLHPEDEGSKILQTTGILLQHYMVSQPVRP